MVRSNALHSHAADRHALQFAWRFRSLLLLLAVALLQAGMPVLVYAHLAHDGALTQDSCAHQAHDTFASNPKAHTQGAHQDTGQAEAHAASESDERCALCEMAGAAPIASVLSRHQGQTADYAAPVGHDHRVSAAAVTTPPATGPPSRS